MNQNAQKNAITIDSTNKLSNKKISNWYQSVMPKGAGALFFIQIFSTLAFSVLYSTSILYATEGLHMNDTLATSITGSFIALNYFLHLLGGYIGGRHLSFRSLFAMGMILQAIGCALISVPSLSFLLWGLAAFLGGSGLNVTCINCMVTQLFEPDDKRREAAFLWNYSGMNIGFFVGFFIAGYFQLSHGYQKLFLLSSFGNIIALGLVIFNWRILNDRDTTYINLSRERRKKSQLIGISMIVALFFALRLLLDQTSFCNQLIMIIGAAMLALITTLAFKQPEKIERHKMFAYIILAISSVIFWTLYQMAPMGLNLFAERNVDRHFLGFIVSPQWIQNINTVVIILGGPILSVVFSRMRERGININIPFQFSLALILIGAGFAILPMGIGLADDRGLTSFNWILMSYILQSLGELFISPIGYAMVGQLAPIKLRGLMMGMWMMITGIASILSGHFSKAALGTSNSTDPLITNASFSHTFWLLGWSSIGIGVLLFVIIPLVAKLIQEKKVNEVNVDLELKEDLAT